MTPGLGSDHATLKLLLIHLVLLFVYAGTPPEQDEGDSSKSPPQTPTIERNDQLEDDYPSFVQTAMRSLDEGDFERHRIDRGSGPWSEREKRDDYPHLRPITGKVYFAIAAPSVGGQTYARAFNRTLLNATQHYLSGGERFRYNLTVDTLTVDLPENGTFSAELLERVCARLEGKHVVGMLIVGDSPAAFTVALTARHAGIPVLWARGYTGVLPGLQNQEPSPLEVQLAPTSRELVTALRGLLLQAHWHSFTLMADAQSAASLQRHDLWGPLSQLPLHPTLISLPSPIKPHLLFRKLADISRSTRGVVVLLCDKTAAVRILDDARRLNMMDGHFVWLWVDTAARISVRGNDTAPVPPSADRRHSQEDRPRRYLDLADIRLNYLLRNDDYLLLSRDWIRPSLEDPRAEKARGTTTGTRGRRGTELPLGLLRVRPLPVKVDRHLVKGAVRLLLTTLRAALDHSSDRALYGLGRRQATPSCWTPVHQREGELAGHFARELKAACGDALAGKKFTQEIGVDKVDKSLVANFEILNLVPERSSKETDAFDGNRTDSGDPGEQVPAGPGRRWKRVGLASGRSVRLDTIIWPGGDLSVAAVSSRARTVFRIVTALAPPFVMESELDEDGQCLRGLPCHRVLTSDKDNLTLVFNEMQRLEEEDSENGESGSSRNSGGGGSGSSGSSGSGSGSPGAGAGATSGGSTDYDDDEDRLFPFLKFKYRTNCCYGLAMDLLENVAQELEFDFRLYIVTDGLYGSRSVVKKRTTRDVGKKYLSYRFKDELEKHASDERRRPTDSDSEEVKWNGIVGDLVSGAAHMSFAALSVSSARSEVIDFSVPYFFSGVSFLAAPQQKSEIPLMAFLLPFSPELWIAIFTSLNITAIAVAIYEWLSPFGLNPWGRQRSKNFSMSSALWVMWGLLCGHLVAFKAPKSWPNKFLINVWGGFSVIFVASYTANIAALIAGLFFHNTVSNYHDRSLLSQKVGAPKASAAEYYVQKANQQLWQHMHKHALGSIEEGIERLRNGSLDILIADTPILNYYQATDHGCKLQKYGDNINEDTYAIGMTKGFPLKDSISAVIAKYSSNGYMDILQEKWYGGLPCFKLVSDIAQPRPLGVAAVTGVFILLGVGMALGLLILLVEHLFFRYTLPRLREKPKGSVWRSRNIMFFSQKLYRFINCVELVSPHHAARELVHTIRQGQITSLFQKSIKRKEHEQRRRRKSKAQFFEMIQEIRSTIRRQQQEEREMPLESVTEVDAEYASPEEKRSRLSPSIIRRTFLRSSPKGDNPKVKSPTGYFNKPLFSPRSKNKTRSSTTLNVRRFSTDSVFSSPQDHRTLIGRRLSKDASHFLTSSPPDINSRRSSYLDMISSGGRLGKSPVLSIENVSDCSSKSVEPLRKLSDSESIGRKLATLPRYQESFDRNRLQPQHSLTLGLGKSDDTLVKSDKCDKPPQVVAPAQSFNSILDPPNVSSNLSDDEIARRNKKTIQELQSQITKPSTNRTPKRTQDNNAKPNTNPQPQIRIQVEDTTKEPATKKHPLTRRSKTRHQSLGDSSNGGEHKRRGRLPEQSKSLDGHSRETSKGRRRREEDLPPAPPPPNCSPRNSDGPSPLERLSKDELVLLWRSSESELRSHLLKALRDKDEPPGDPT